MLDKTKVLEIALAHAKNDWCLDDESLLEELLGHMQFNNALDVRCEVDRIGEHYGLERPATWGI